MRSARFAMASALALTGCVTTPTAVYCTVGTDVAAETPLALRVTIRPGVLSLATLLEHPGPDVMVTPPGYPASFTITPGPGQLRDSVFTLLVEGTSDAPALALRQLRHVRFRPGMGQSVTIVLAARCAEIDEGCACTRARRCEAEGKTCGNDGACAPLALDSDVPACRDCTLPLPDAGPSDATTPTDAAVDGGSPVSVAGCADGAREGFAAIDRYPAIAACAGGFSRPGLLATSAPACGRAAGDDGTNPAGTGCAAADLCAAGWHLCATRDEVRTRSADGCSAAAGADSAPAFFATAQSGAGGAQCGAGTDDLFGCGSLGAVPDAVTCSPLDRFSNNLCASLGAPWNCGTDGGAELSAVTKPGVTGGGVLCCRN